MKPHLWIAEDRDRGPGFARKAVSQEMIHSSADFFIIRSLRDACDASVCIKPQSCVLFKRARTDLSNSALVLPFTGPAVQKMNEIRLRGRFANGGDQMLQFGVRHFFIRMRDSPTHSLKSKRRNEQDQAFSISLL